MEKSTRSPALRRTAALFTVMAAASLAACGGGGGSASTALATATPVSEPVPTPAATGDWITADQEGAQRLVSATNTHVNAVEQAEVTSSAPVGALSSNSPTGVTTSSSTECASYAGSAGSGSGNITHSMTYDEATARASSSRVTYNNCSWSFSGYTFSYNGTLDYSYSYVSNTQYSITSTYNLTYATTGLYDSSGTLTNSSTCTFSGATSSCYYNVGTAAVSDITVAKTGTTTTIAKAIVKTQGEATTNNLTISYTDWVYDSASGRATAGTVAATDTGGNSATVAVTSTGYRVTIVYGGVTSVYDLPA